MQPQKDYRNGDSCAACGEEAAEAGDGQLTFEEPELVPAALRALNTMRKNRQFFDVVLHTGNVEVPAHRAVLAAVSPYLFELFTTDQDRSGAVGNASLPLSYKLNGICEKSALQTLVDYAYTGKLTISTRHVRAVYLCAWQLRMDGVVARCGDHLVSSLCLDSCIEVRSLPGLSVAHFAAVDKFIASNFRNLYGSAALSGLPVVKLEVLQTSLEAPAESPHAVAALAFHWLKGEMQEGNASTGELASRTHLLYVATDRSLRDCAALPPARTDAPVLQDYRRKAAAAHAGKSKKNGAAVTPPVSGVPLAANGRARVLIYTHDIAERQQMEPDWKVIASDKVGENTYLSLCVLGGPLVQVSVCARACETPLPSPAPLAHAPPECSDGGIAHMEQPRCAHGTVVYHDTIVVCGGYDRVECLKSCERYDAARNVWTPLPDMRQARGRFNIAKVGNKIFAVGGSDGHVELDSVEMLELPAGGAGDVVDGRSMSTSVESVGGSEGSCGEEERSDGEQRHNGHSDAGAQPSEKIPSDVDKRKKAWSKKARLPLARSHAAVCGFEAGGACEERVYCVGGWTGQVGVRDCHVYDVQRDEWSAMASLNTGRHQAGACVWAGWLWVLGGCDAWHCLASTERHALAPEEDSHDTGAWHTGPPLTTARRSVAAVVWRGRLVAVGGSDGAASLRSVDLLASPDGAWAAGPALREPRAALGAAVVGDRLYAVGGFSGKLFLSSMECLSEPDGEWTTLLAPHTLRSLSLPPQLCRPIPAEHHQEEDEKLREVREMLETAGVAPAPAPRVA